MNARPPKATPIPAHPGLQVLSDEVVWDGRFPLQLVRFSRTRFDGTQGGEQAWELRRRGTAVAVLPWDPWADRVALIEQFRLPALAAGLPPVMVEVPAGFRDAGEDPAAAVRRELAEETGLVADRLLGMGRYILNQGDSDEVISLFLARTRLPAPGQAGTHGLAAEQEDIRVLVVDALDAIAMLDDNRMCNATGALCLSGFSRRRDALLKDWTD
jgi:ADP-ribose pyrophosphatase